MADVNQPVMTLTASGDLTYAKTPHHPTLALSASGVVDYTPTLPFFFTGSSDIEVFVGGEMLIEVTPTAPPEGIDSNVGTVTPSDQFTFTFDRFGRPV